MDLTMLAKDHSSGLNGCPSVYLAENGKLVIQGDGLDASTSANLQNVLPGEGAVQIDLDVVIEALRKLGR